MNHERKPIHYEELSARLRPVFDSVRTSTPQNISAIKKSIKIDDYFGVTDEAVWKFFKPEFERLASYDTFHLAAIIETIGIFWVFIGRNLFPQMRVSTLTYIQHENGRVREAMRRVGEYIRMAPEGHSTRSSVPHDEYRSFLRELAALTRALRRDATKSRHVHTIEEVRDLPPSPYKSACLLWEKVARKDIHTNWLSDVEIEALEMLIPPPWISFQDEEVEEPVFETWEQVRDTLQERLKKESQSAYRAELEALHAHAHNLLAHAMHGLGYADSDVRAVYEHLRAEGTLAGNGPLMRVYHQQQARHKNFSPDILNEFVRAFQAASNHYVFDTRGYAYSHLLVAVIQQRDAYEEKEPARASEFLRHLLMVHDAIRSISERYVTYVASEFAHISDELPSGTDERTKRAKYDAIKIKHEFLARAKTESAYMAPILHHYADWYAQIEPWAFIRERPTQLAAKLFLIVQKFNASRNISFCSMIGARELAAFTDRKSASAVQDAPLYDLITGTARDPDLLLYPFGRVYDYREIRS